MAVGALDSKAVFEARLKAIDIPDVVTAALSAGGVDTMAKLAFLTGCQPGVGDDSPFVNAVSTMLGYDASNVIPAGLLAGLRRIWFESHTIAISEVRQKLEKSEDHPKRLPLAEREVRRTAQQNRLNGVLVEGALEPSHALIDAVYTIRDEEIVKYIEPCNCTSRLQELKGVKREQFLKIDGGAGNIKHVSRDVLGVTDVSSEYKLRLALQRRNLAFDQLDILPYEVGEKYVNMLFDLTTHTVPSTHSPITMEQIMIADKHVWLKISEVCRTGVCKSILGYPLEEALKKALADPIVMSSLQPLPKSRGGSHSESWKKETSYRPGPYQDERPSYDKGKGKGKKGKNKSTKGSGKSKQYTGGGPMPNELRGGSSKNSDGVPVCFNFNLRGCQGAKPGERCQKGLHVCAKCFATDHVFSQRTRST